ncbi:MAG: peptide ABC transporter substrate-binding protein [Rhodospirillaceae bacterium]|nr:peptide ABC transporter substrate-binding protein [Rhodospirillaceae bacterium]
MTSVEQLLAREIFTGLVTIDAAGQLTPGLAESWSVSPDGQSYTFTLRPRLQWSDGKAIDATDIVDSFKRALDPATAAPFVGFLLTIRNAEAFRLGTLGSGEALGVSAPDRRTVRFDLSAPSKRFMDVLAQAVASPVPLHRIAQLKEAWAEPFVVIGNGPFATMPAGDRYALKRNEKFFASSTTIPGEIQLTIVSNGDEALTAIRRGDLDLALGFIPAPISERTSMRGAASASPFTVYSLVVNTDHAPFNLRELRHALGMAIDRDGIIKTQRLSEAISAYNLVPPGVANYSAYRAPYAKLSQPDRRVVAGALLLDVDPRAVPPIRLAHPEGRSHAAMITAVSKAWRDLGFTVTPVPRSEAQHETAVLEGDFDVAVMPQWSQIGDMDRFLHSFSQIAGPWNIARYREVSFDERLVQADVQMDSGYRMGLLREAEGVLIQDQVSWPLVFMPATVMARDRLSGLEANAAGVHPLRLIGFR